MADDKQTTKPEDQTKDSKTDELNADDLDQVSGGVSTHTANGLKINPNKVVAN